MSGSNLFVAGMSLVGAVFAFLQYESQQRPEPKVDPPPVADPAAVAPAPVNATQAVAPTLLHTWGSRVRWAGISEDPPYAYDGSMGLPYGFKLDPVTGERRPCPAIGMPHYMYPYEGADGYWYWPPHPIKGADGRWHRAM